MKKYKCLALLYNNNRPAWQNNVFNIIRYFLEQKDISMFKIGCEKDSRYCDFINLRNDKNTDCMKCKNNNYFNEIPTIELSNYITHNNDINNFLDYLPNKLSSKDLSLLNYKDYNIGKPIMSSLTYQYQSMYKDMWETDEGTIVYEAVKKTIIYYEAYNQLFEKIKDIKYIYVDDIYKIMWMIPIDIALRYDIKFIFPSRKDLKKNLFTFKVYSKLSEFNKDNARLPSFKKICNLNNENKEHLINSGKNLLDKKYLILKSTNNQFIQLKKRLKDYKQTFCIFLNCFFDLGLIKGESIFDTFFDYLEYTIKYINKDSDSFLIIKLHPLEKLFCNETNLPSKISKICNKYKLKNFEILNCDSSITTFHLSELIDVGITMCGSIIPELNYKGKQALCLSDNGFSNRGCGVFVSDRDSYKNYLANINAIPKVNKSNIYNSQLLMGLFESDFLFISFSDDVNFDIKLSKDEVINFINQEKVKTFIDDKFLT